MRKLLYGSVLSFMGLCGAFVAVAENTNNVSDNANNKNNNYVVGKAVDGKFTIKGDIGYLYNFASKWNIDNAQVKGAGNSSVGYGASLGYTHKSGIGLSADYLGFGSKWNTDGTNYQSSFHALTLTPNYRFSLDKSQEWGLRVGLGLGVALSDINWGNNAVGASGVAKNGTVEGISADGAYYTRAGGKNFTAGLCGNKVMSLVGDSTSGQYANRCVLFPEGKVLGSFPGSANNQEIARWLVSDPQARLGDGRLRVSNSPIAHDVWTLLVRGANHDPVALNILTSARAKPVTAAQAKETLQRMLGGFDGAQHPDFQAYNAPGANGKPLVSGSRAADLGIDSVSEAKMKAAGYSFAPAAPPPPPPAPKPAPPPPPAPKPAPAQTGPKEKETIKETTTETIIIEVPPEPQTGMVTNGKANSQVGFVLVPQVALEYDNGLFHGDI
ncbi:MAG: hypothetical protein ORN57_03755, partial [Alphaproteobacteria bacterium]|nr:hypothetical protein [Alphaproteobacteria bacterium]